MFREMKNINVPYKHQGLLHFLCLNYDYLPQDTQQNIVQLCIATTSEYYQPLFKLLTTDTAYYPAWRIASDYYINVNLLYKLKRKFFENWYKNFRKELFYSCKSDM